MTQETDVNQAVPETLPQPEGGENSAQEGEVATALFVQEDAAQKALPRENTENNEGKNSAEVATKTAPFMVKYNGEQVEVSAEEARALIQKGMNYDKIYERLQRLGQQEENAEISVKKADLPARDFAAEMKALLTRKPGLSALPERAVELAAQGWDIFGAYQESEIERLNRELEALETHYRNKSLPKSARGLGDEQQSDSFLKGFSE